MCALYPDLMNIYADRGNLLVLERRCRWRGIGFQLHASGLGEQLDGERHDLFYIGGGQDRDQQLCAEDLIANKRAGLHAAAAARARSCSACAAATSCSGTPTRSASEEIEGVALLDVRTVRSDGPAADRQRRDRGLARGRRAPTTPSGCSPASRTTAGAPAWARARQPLGRVLSGHGNDGSSGFEGARTANTIGTYLHGPLLPKNAWFADWLIARALGIDPDELAPLDDDLEHATHAERPPRGRRLSVPAPRRGGSRKLRSAPLRAAGTGL